MDVTDDDFRIAFTTESRLPQAAMSSLLFPLPTPPPPPPPPPPSPHQLPPMTSQSPKLFSNEEENEDTKCGVHLIDTFSSEEEVAIKSLKLSLPFLGLDELMAEPEASDLTCTSFYQPVRPVIQNGPLCGMVALAMASELIPGQTPVSTEDIFAEARNCGYSHQGEMFSASCLQKLAEKFLTADVKLLRLPVLDDANNLDGRSLMKLIMQGHLILVPYDADRNHGPCLKKGHKAHWALITGFFSAFKFKDSSVKELLLSHCKKDQVVPSVYAWSTENKVLSEQSFALLEENMGPFFVYAHQGKSKYAGIWPLTDLLQSTGNLLEAGPLRGGTDYIMPDGSVKEGLCGQVVVIKPFPPS